MDSGGKSEMELVRNMNKTYAKRIKGLQKKIYEFSTLVGVDAAMIAYRPRKGNNHRQVLPDTYPENLRDVIPVVKRYLGVPKAERTKRHKQYSGPSGDDAKNKTGDDNSNASLVIVRDNSINDNAAADGLEWDGGFDNLSVDRLQQLAESVKSKMQELDEKIVFMEDKENQNPSCVTSGSSEHGVEAAAAATTSSVQMQPAYVLQPFNQNFTGLANGSAAMVPTVAMNGFGFSQFRNNGVTTNGSNASYPMVMQYPMNMMSVQPGGGNQMEFGNHQGPFTFFMPQVFVQPMTTSYIPNLMSGGASSDA